MSKRRKTPPPTHHPTPDKVVQSEKPLSIQQQTKNSDISFTTVSHLLPVFVFAEVIQHGIDEICTAQENIENITSSINQGIAVKDSQKLIEYIHLLINLKESVLKFISWTSALASIVDCELSNDHTPEQMLSIIPKIGERLKGISQSMDCLLTTVPQEPVLGITLAPDQKQFSETKAMISKILARLSEIQREDEEAEKDWGRAEQNAYERMRDSSSQNIPVEEFLNWLDELERGKDV